jgi:hypothetical protein
MFEYKVINVFWNTDNWKRLLELELNDAARDGWKPILSSDGGHAVTLILERALK